MRSQLNKSLIICDGLSTQSPPYRADTADQTLSAFPDIPIIHVGLCDVTQGRRVTLKDVN